MSVWEEIKTRLRVDEVIAEYVQVQVAGSSYRCRCPFHNDKTPSLIISPEKGIWHCFGCGQGGDIFKFVMDFENITKQEALQKLAQKASIVLPDRKAFVERADTLNGLGGAKVPVLSSKFADGLKYLSWASQVYHQVLLKIFRDRQHPVTQYCLERGLNLEIVEKFQLGFAPKNNLILHLAQKHRLNPKLLESTGILKRLEDKIIRSQEKDQRIAQFKDKFSDRLMIPISNKQGQVIGFTGRVLPYDKTDRPKYLNSPQTDWFSKSELWYGWHLARRQILQQKKAILVEGNMDVISSFQFGLDYTIASQGTSFTLEQLKLLSTITKTIWLAFDNDEAGQLAGEKLFRVATSLGLETYKVVIPLPYKDLDEYLRSLPTEFHTGQNPPRLETKPFLEYILQYKSRDLSSSEASKQKEAILHILDLVATMDELSGELYLPKLAQASGVSQSTLKKLLNEKKQTHSEQRSYAQSSSLSDSNEPKLATPYQTNVNLVLVTWQKLASLVKQRVAPQTHEQLRDLFGLLNVFLPELQAYPTLEEYLIQNQEVLELIYNQEIESKDDAFEKQLWQNLMSFLDQRLGQIMLSEDLKDKYLRLKQAA